MDLSFGGIPIYRLGGFHRPKGLGAAELLIFGFDVVQEGGGG
jgi:hypothetical protein